jgi:LEA14-like dessication related protein
MKKVLLFGGIGLAGFSLYRYFKYQVNQALNYDYKIKNFKYTNVDVENNKIDVSLDIFLTNNSSFEIVVRSYDLKFAFKGVDFASSKSNNSFVIMPNTSFPLKISGTLDLKKAKISVLPLVQDILGRKPINIEVSGNVKVKFIGINSTINFNHDSFQYSADLLKEYNLAKPFEKFKLKNPKLAQLLGIK